MDLDSRGVMDGMHQGVCEWELSFWQVAVQKGVILQARNTISFVKKRQFHKTKDVLGKKTYYCKAQS